MNRDGNPSRLCVYLLFFAAPGADWGHFRQCFLRKIYRILPRAKKCPPIHLPNDKRPPTSIRDAVGLLWILPRPKNSPPDCFLNGLSNPIIYKITGTQRVSRCGTCSAPLPTSIRDAVKGAGILPRAKKVSTGHFFTLPTVGPLFRIPFIP